MADDPQTTDPSPAGSVPVPDAPAAGDPVAALSTPPGDVSASAAGSNVSSVVIPDDPSAMLDEAAIEELLRQAEFQTPTAVEAGSDRTAASPSLGGDVAMPPMSFPTESFDLPNFQQVMGDAAVSNIDLLRDVELNVKIELGRSRMLVDDVLKLGEGSVVELDKLAGDPVDVFVNDRLVARGEVLVLNENFCVRVNEIVAGLKDEGN